MKLRKVTIQEIQKLVFIFKGRSKQIDNCLRDNEILRMALTASRIPIAEGPNSRILDIGGSILWLPIYSELLGYKKIIILCRSYGGFTNAFKKKDIGEEVKLKILNCDAELEKYPISNGQISTIVSFALLEHFAGDPMNLIAESNRILKDEGYLCLTSPNVISAVNLAKLTLGRHPFGWSVFTDSFADRHNREYTPYEVSRLLEAGGFDVHLLETFSCDKNESLILRLFGYLLSCPASIFRIVPFAMRRKTIYALGKKAGPVLDRYPSFLYNLYGADKVQYKIPSSIQI